MATSFAAVFFRPAEVSDRALSQGFAVALAGWDVPAPRLLIAPLPGIPGYCAAFYASGAGAGEDEIEHAFDLFEDELSPALAVLDAAVEQGAADARVYALTYAEGAFHDDAWRFDARGFERHFVHEEDDEIEAGTETPDSAETVAIEAGTREGERATEAEEMRALEAAARPHRGSTFLSKELGAPVLATLVGALYAVERLLHDETGPPLMTIAPPVTTNAAPDASNTPPDPSEGAPDPRAAARSRAVEEDASWRPFLSSDEPGRSRPHERLRVTPRK